MSNFQFRHVKVFHIILRTVFSCCKCDENIKKQPDLLNWKAYYSDKFVKTTLTFYSFVIYDKKVFHIVHLEMKAIFEYFQWWIQGEGQWRRN